MLYKGEVRRDYTYARQFRRVVIDVALFFLLPHYGSWWKLRVAALSAKLKLTKRLLERCCRNFVDRFGAYIPLNASIDNPPYFPHELYGIFISNKAKIGRNVTIFQQVTIGSNTLKRVVFLRCASDRRQCDNRGRRENHRRCQDWQ